jgi:MFS family permease
MRIHGLEPNVVGYMLGVYSIAVGLLGVLLGGWLADWLLARGFHDAKVRLGIITNLLWIPFGIAYPLMPSWLLAMAFMVPGGVISTMTYGVAPAGVQEMMPNRLRGQASAVFIFTITILGLGLGPFALALCTDYLFKDEKLVHLSLITVSVIAHSLSLIFLVLARKPYVQTVERLHAETTQPGPVPGASRESRS